MGDGVGEKKSRKDRDHRVDISNCHVKKSGLSTMQQRRNSESSWARGVVTLELSCVLGKPLSGVWRRWGRGRVGRGTIALIPVTGVAGGRGWGNTAEVSMAEGWVEGCWGSQQGARYHELRPGGVMGLEASWGGCPMSSRLSPWKLLLGHFWRGVCKSFHVAIWCSGAKSELEIKMWESSTRSDKAFWRDVWRVKSQGQCGRKDLL